eukprot:484247-Rhodomonas_salina.1
MIVVEDCAQRRSRSSCCHELEIATVPSRLSVITAGVRWQCHVCAGGPWNFLARISRNKHRAIQTDMPSTGIRYPGS